jgi:hypothetical protein
LSCSRNFIEHHPECLLCRGGCDAQHQTHDLRAAIRDRKDRGRRHQFFRLGQHIIIWRLRPGEDAHLHGGRAAALVFNLDGARPCPPSNSMRTGVICSAAARARDGNNRPVAIPSTKLAAPRRVILKLRCIG